MSSIDTSQIPQEVHDLAAQLGTSVEEIVAGNPAIQAALAQQPPAEGAPVAHAAADAGGVAGTSAAQVPGAAVPGVQVQEGVTARPAETPQEKLERENAVLQQELGQVRQLAQTAQEGRVVGSGGLSGPVQPEIPTLASIEPGIRFLVRNGLIEADALLDKFGPVVVDLLKKDIGGIV